MPSRMLSDVTAHLATLRSLQRHHPPLTTPLFTCGRPIHIARAPGRLDVMGGIADYSGSLVLQLPIAEAAIASVQQTDDGAISVVSLDHFSGVARTFQLSATEW